MGGLFSFSISELRPDFVISDTHFHHENIVKYQDRPFAHNEIMLKRWRSTVKDSQTVLHLGDLFFGKGKGTERFANEIAPYLTGTKYLLLGNHDHRRTDYEALGFTVIKPYEIEYAEFTVSFDHYPALIHPKDKHLRVHGHIHTNGYGPEQAPTRVNNINVSVEVIDYRPQRLTQLLNTAIRARKERQPYYNSKALRYASLDRRRRLQA